MNRNAIILFLVWIVSCSGFKRISNTDLSWLYRDEKFLLNPEYSLLHVSKDSTRIFLKLPVKDILYKRNESGEWKSGFSLRILLFPSYESKKLIDSATCFFSPPFSDDTSAFILKEFTIKKPVKNCLMVLRLNDLNRGAFKENFISLDASIQSSQEFYVSSNDADYPLFNRVVDDSEMVRVNCPATTTSLMVRCYFNDYPVATPPFSSKPPVVLSYYSDSVIIPAKEEDGYYHFSLSRSGMYHIQYDTLTKNGYTVFKFNAGYPAITASTQLIAALRYLTTTEEFNKLTNASDKKEAIDRFWIDISGSKERARFLIKTFYSRMKNANQFFTSYLEGWKTDRGMIYLVFGPPKTVYKTSEAEYWDYGFFKGYGSLNFSFRKIANPFTDNDFLLMRSASYEPVWYMAVDQWRQGRITATE